MFIHAFLALVCQRLYGKWNLLKINSNFVSDYNEENSFCRRECQLVEIHGTNIQITQYTNSIHMRSVDGILFLCMQQRT